MVDKKLLEENKDKLIKLDNGHFVPRALSYSRLDNFLSCRLRYKYNAIDSKPEPESKPLEVGIAVHEVLEEYFGEMIERGESRDVEYIKELMYDQDLKPEYWNEAFDICVDFAKYTDVMRDAPYDDYQLEGRFAIGKDLEPTDWNSDDAVFRGIMDFVKKEDDAVIIKDFKTNQQIPAQSKIDSDLQLGSYAWMLSKVYPDIDYFNIALWFVRYGHTQERIISRGELDHIENRLMGHFDKVSEAEIKEEFPATISKDCKWCSYANICPEYQEARDEIEPEKFDIDDEDEAQERAERYKMLQRVKNDLKGELEDYIQEEERGIDTGDQILTFHETSSYNFDDPKSVFIELKKLGISIDEAWRAMKVSKKDLKKILRKNDEYDQLDNIIDTVGERTTKTRFAFKDKENIS